MLRPVEVGAIALVFLFSQPPLRSAELSRRALNEFQRYMAAADLAMTARASSAERLQASSDGEPMIRSWNRSAAIGMADAMVHDWIGAAFVPGGKLADAVAVLQDVDRYSQVYEPQVLESKLLTRQGDRLHIRLRLIKKKVITVVLDTEYDVEYMSPAEGKTQVLSRSTRIAEVENAGRPNEKIKPPDTGYGFLWRLNSYWLLEARDGGVYMECRAISLTRDIPALLAWMVKPMVTALPRESLAHTLTSTRQAVGARISR